MEKTIKSVILLLSIIVTAGIAIHRSMPELKEAARQGTALVQTTVSRADELPGGEQRVKAARESKEDALKKLFAAAKVKYPPDELFFRAFKIDGENENGTLEMWARSGDMERMVLIESYPVCAASGQPGPKRREGDRQVPEGFYYIDRFNDHSSYHLSLGLNYPNKSDRILGDPDKPGGDIFIHGACVSIGCLAMTDDAIDEIFIAAIDTRDKSGKKIPVHIFPTRMDKSGMMILKDLANGDAALITFWFKLREGYMFFKDHGVPPEHTVDEKGTYFFTPLKK